MYCIACEVSCLIEQILYNLERYMTFPLFASWRNRGLPPIAESFLLCIITVGNGLHQQQQYGLQIKYKIVWVTLLYVKAKHGVNRKYEGDYHLKGYLKGQQIFNKASPMRSDFGNPAMRSDKSISKPNNAVGLNSSFKNQTRPSLGHNEVCSADHTTTKHCIPKTKLLNIQDIGNHKHRCVL